MTKKPIRIALMCLFFLNSAYFSSGMQKENNRFNISGISEKQVNPLARKQIIQTPYPDASETETLKSSKMGPILNNFLAGKGDTSVIKTGRNKDMIRLIINTTDNKAPVYNAINKYKAKILNKHDGLIAVEVPSENVETLINETDEIRAARLPAKVFPLDITNEGVSLVGAGDLHNEYHLGAGVRIAVIDVGFKGLTDAYLNGDIPYGVRTCDFTGNGIETEYYHGTGCAELIHDMAPAAELYLLKVSDEIHIYSAIDYCIDNEIDIISFSLGASGTGPGDGTGSMDEYFDRATDNGILTVAAAGNYATFLESGYSFGGHWEGVFNPDSDDRHVFVQDGQTSYYNVIGAYPTQNDDNEPVTGEVSVMMRWNDSRGYSLVDYDIYLYKYDYENDEILDTDSPAGFSNIVQNGYQYPIEQIYIDLPDSEDYAHYYALVIKKKSGEPVLTDMEIYLGGTSTFLPFNGYSSAIATSGGSITEPADVERVLAVGAIFYDDWDDDGPQEPFSSQGPTNAWGESTAMIKPDISGPDGVSTYTFGVESFFGTSASTPLVAGAAALIKSVYPGYSPEELKAYIESSALDMGDEGKDNLYGWGRINLTPDSSVDPDQDGDGLPDAWEILYGFDNTTDDSAGDPDSDGYTNLMEYRSGTAPLDADTDDDGISDGDEDTDKDSTLDTGETFPSRTDSDDDQLQDGTELGVTEGISDPDGSGPMSGTDTALFIPDSDPSTVTDPMDADSDGDGIKDGEEDKNQNGRLDTGETDPNSYNGSNGSSDNNDSDGDGGGCFIATASYNSITEPYIVKFRQYMDKIIRRARQLSYP